MLAPSARPQAGECRETAASTEYRPPPDQMNARQMTDRKAGYSNPPRCDQNPAGNLVSVATIITLAAPIAASGVISPIASSTPVPNCIVAASTAGTRPPRIPSLAKPSAAP